MAETREPINIRFNKEEVSRIDKVAKASGETRSGWIRRQIMTIVIEEELQEK